MDSADFRKRGKEMVDYIVDYMDNINCRRVTPEVEPGYLRNMLPRMPPTKGEPWESVMKDIECSIMPGITHWQHPRFHAYFPAGNSYPSILGDMLSDAIGCVGFSWAASPACAELETVVLDWIGRMIGLPDVFLHEEGVGGGVIQGSASECILVTLLAARHSSIRQLKTRFPFVEDGILLSKLVAYSSKLAHSCVEKAGMIGFVKMRQLDVDENYSLRGHVLERAIEEDRRLGLIPFYVCATLGTTACCSFDNIDEIGEVCDKENVWLHVDAAYAGNALICPEFQHLLKGAENMNSLNFNPNKWMLVNFDCSLLWVRDRDILVSALTVDPLYLQHKHGDKAIDFRRSTSHKDGWNSFLLDPDGISIASIASKLLKLNDKKIRNHRCWVHIILLKRRSVICNMERSFNREQVTQVLLLILKDLVKQIVGQDNQELFVSNKDCEIPHQHWGIPLSRRFRSLKLWFVIRTYGVEGLQKYIREHVRLAKLFESFVRKDDRFEVLGAVTMGLVCFRLKGSNTQTQKLLHMINESGKIHMVPALINEHYVIRFAVCAQNAEDDDIDFAWNVIVKMATQLLQMRSDSNKESEKLDAEGASEEENEVFPDFENEIIFDNQRSTLSRAKIRRSLFQKMVSDPKSYNPRVLKSLSLESRRHRSESLTEEVKYVPTPDYYFGTPL